MTREEAIKILEKDMKNATDAYCYHLAGGGSVDCELEDYFDAMYSAMDALRERETVTKCHDLFDEDGGEILNRTESDTVKPVEIDQFSRWISVKDQLPEPFVSVLVYMPGERPLPTVHEGYFVRDANKWYSHFFDRGLDEVTHWMPLPEAPEVEG